MKGKSVLTSQQIAHVLALHLAGRSLFIEELALLTGNVLPASDERWRELERLGLAERVSSPHGTAWKAGDVSITFYYIESKSISSVFAFIYANFKVFPPVIFIF